MTVRWRMAGSVLGQGCLDWFAGVVIVLIGW